MARREYQMKNTLATDPPLRFYFCDAAADYPQAATLRDGDIIYDADLNVLLTADAGVLSSAHAAADAYTPDEETDWPGTVPTTKTQALDLLAARVTILEP